MQVGHHTLQGEDAVAAVAQGIQSWQAANDQALLPAPATQVAEKRWEEKKKRKSTDQNRKHYAA